MEITEYLRAIRRGWRIALAAVLACVTLAAVATALATPQYRSSSQLFVSATGAENPTDLTQGSNFAQRQIATYADLVTAPIVLEPVIETLGLQTTVADLAPSISASVQQGTVLITVAATDEDPIRAADLANAVSTQFAVSVQDLERVQETEPSPVKVTVVRAAELSTSPSSPNPARNIALGVVIGMLLGLAGAVLRDLLDTRVSNADDVARVTDRTIIGTIAFDKSAVKAPLIVQADPHSPRAEAFRTLRTNLQFIDAAERPRSIVFTSSLPAEGKTTTTANLALTIAASGASVVVVEGDLRRPRLLDYMGMEGSVGLTTVLIGEVDLDDVLQPFGPRVSVLGAGAIPPNPSELLGSPAMAALLQELETRFDYVVIDAPPLLPVTDAAVLSKVADGTIVVVGSRVIKREHLSRALQTLETVDAHVLGMVINRLPISVGDSYRYYRDGYAPESTGAREGQGSSTERTPRHSAAAGSRSRS